MSKRAYRSIARLQKRVFEEAGKLATLNSGPHTPDVRRIIVLGHGARNPFGPIKNLFVLDRFGSLDTIDMRCPVIIKINPFKPTTRVQCHVYARLKGSDIVMPFSESVDISLIHETVAQAQIAALETKLSLASIKAMEPYEVERFYERAERQFSNHEVVVEVHGLQRPTMEICMFPGLRASHAGGDQIRQIIEPYLEKKQATFLVHPAHLPLTSSYSLSLLSKYGDPYWSGLVFRTHESNHDDETVKEALLKDPSPESATSDPEIYWREPATWRYKIANAFLQDSISR